MANRNTFESYVILNRSKTIAKSQSPFPPFESYVILNRSKTLPVRIIGKVVFESYVILNRYRTTSSSTWGVLLFESHIILNTIVRTKKPLGIPRGFLAPRVWFEQTTYRLTAGCSTAELTRHIAHKSNIIISKCVFYVNTFFILV